MAVLKTNPDRVIEAIPGTGGIRKKLAERLGCNYCTLLGALKIEGEEWDMVRKCLIQEEMKIGDLAEETVIDVMEQRLDMSVASTTARWFLDRKHSDRGYGKKSQVTLEGGHNPIKLAAQQVLPLDELDLPLKVKKQILDAMEKLEGRNNIKEAEAVTAELP